MQCSTVLLRLTGWDDVGDFSSLADLLPAELNQPRILGDSGLGMSSPLSFRDMLRRINDGTWKHSCHRAGCGGYRCARVRPADFPPWSRRSGHCRHARHLARHHTRAFAGGEAAREEVSRRGLEAPAISLFFCLVISHVHLRSDMLLDSIQDQP